MLRPVAAQRRGTAASQVPRGPHRAEDSETRGDEELRKETSPPFSPGKKKSCFSFTMEVWHCSGLLAKRKWVVKWQRRGRGKGKGTAKRQESFLSTLYRHLPVFQLPRHPLGDAAAQQPHQEEGEHAQRHHQQDVVLGRRRHHLHGQVREAVCRRHLRAGGRDRWVTGSCSGLPGFTPELLHSTGFNFY